MQSFSLAVQATSMVSFGITLQRVRLQMADAKNGDTKDLVNQNKKLTIIVNGRTTPVESDEITFDEVVNLAFPERWSRTSNRLHRYVLQRRR